MKRTYSDVNFAPAAPKELQKLGCINLETNDSSQIKISPRFQIDTTVLATASTDRSVVNTIGNNDGIHPVFRRSDWKETSDAEYEHLKPVLRIATQMMAMEGFLDLWTALGQPLQRLPQNNMLRRQNEQHRVYYTGKTSPGQRGRTQQEMLGLCNYVTYSWEHDDDLAAVTTAIASKRGLRPGPFR